MAAPGKDAAGKNQRSSADSAENGGESQQEFDKDEDGPDQILKRDEWFYKQRSSVNGHIPAGARFNAFQHMQRMMAAEGKVVRRADGSYAAVAAPAAGSPAWASIGPTPTTGGTFSPVTGRVTTIAVDPSDSTGNTVLIGGAQGGIWRSTDAGATWTALGDQNPSLAMGSIAFASPPSATVYAGTGEQASIGFDIYYGAGVLKSTDHGQTWTQTCTVAGPTCPFLGPYRDSLHPGFGFFNFGGARISYLAVNPSNPNMVLVGAQFLVEDPLEGVYCSDNGGQTWSNVLADQMSTFVGFASSSVAYAALANPFGSSPNAPNGNGIYKATGIGSTCASIRFSRLTAASLPPQISMGRIDLGIAPSDPTGNTVYASIADASTFSDTNLGVFVTTTGGTSWTHTPAPDVCRFQCWYDNVVKVDPVHANIAYFGGGAVTSAANPSWIVRTTDTGGTWATVIPSAPGPGFPHVDTHALAFARLPGGKVRLYLGNDGGIWRTDDAEAATVTWTNLNNASLTLSQFYPALSIHTSNPATAYGGTQDNSSQQYAGTPVWGVSTRTVNTPSGPVISRVCGDGGQTAVDAQVPSTVYISCQDINIHASYSDGSAGSFFPAINGIDTTDFVNFIPPLATDPGTANVVYFGTTKIYQSVDAGNTWTFLSGGDLVGGFNGDVLTALSVDPGNSSVVYAGSSSGLIFSATNVSAGSASFAQHPNTGIFPQRTVTAIAIVPADATGNTAYFSFSGFSFVGTDPIGRSFNDPTGHVFKTIDGGFSLIDVSCSTTDCSKPAASDLPNIPANDIVLDPDAPGTIYVPTDLGVFVGNCTVTPCTWGTLGTGLPHVAVLSLRLHEASRTLRAATHGRGVWDLNLNNVSFTGPRISSLTPTSVTAGGNSFTLTVQGAGLMGGVIQWKASATGVTMLPGGTDTTLTATIDASLLTGGTANITAQISSAPSTTSNALPFSVLAATPTLTSINPASTPVQTPPVPPIANVQIQLNGTNFASSARVLFNGAQNSITVAPPSSSCPLPTCLSVTLPANLLGPFGSTNDIAVLNLPPGGGQSQTLTFKVVAPPPPNDNFARAINITTLNFGDIEDSSSASPEPADPLPPCAQQISVANGNTGGLPNGLYNTIWYKFTPIFSANLDVFTYNSSYDTVLSIWSGSPGNLTAVACNDDIVPGIRLQSELFGVPLTANTPYYIMVSSFGPPDPNPIALGGESLFNLLYNGGFYPTPTITSMSQSTANSGDPGFTLTVNGSDFLNGSTIVLRNNAFFTFDPLTTTFVSPTQLTAVVPASEIVLPGTFLVLAQGPQPSLGFSNGLNFTVNLGTYPVPRLDSLFPTSIVAGSLPFSLSASGDNIGSSAVLSFNGMPKSTSVRNPLSLSALISTADIMSPGIVQVTIANPAPGGGTSSSLPFTIIAPNPLPTLASLSPTSAPIGTATNITLTGSDFLPGASVFFNNSYWGASVASSTQLSVFLSFGGVTAGTYPVYVVDPPPGGTSNPINFTVVGPPDFSITSSGTTSVTVAAGQTAMFPNVISVSALNGFASPVNFSCPPPAAATTCSVNPVSLPSGSGSASVSVTTTARSMVPPTSPHPPLTMRPMLLPAILFALLLCALFLRFARARPRRFTAALPIAVILVFLILPAGSCGGGGGSGGFTQPPPPVTGTQPGTYMITVTGASGSMTHTTTLQLIVN